MKEEVVEEEVDAEGGLDLGKEIEMKEDVGGSGESHEHIVGISDEAAEKGELMGRADIRGADAGCTALASVAEGEVGIETEGCCDNGSGIEIKEDIMESGDFHERVVGICDEETPKAELMESVYAEEENVVVADVADGEEDVGVGGNREELIEDGGIDNKALVEGQDDVVVADVDDSGVSKEEEVVAMVVEEDGAAFVEEEEVVVEDNVGSHDVGVEKGVVDVNETEKASVSEFFPNVESTSGVVAFAVEESEIADSKAEISLAENERVTGGDGESNDVVGMVNEIPMVGKDIGEMDVGINAGVNGVAETDERETGDFITDEEEKEQDAAAVGVLGMLSDDANIEADETNGLANVDSTEGTDRKEVGDVGAEIDVEADDSVEDNVPEDKEMDDVLEETQDTELVDRPEETDATEDTDVAEEEMEKVEQRKMNVLLNRKGGKSSKGGRASSKKKLEEDVCFICFDGGDLVLCDRRGCPKVYHPSCVNRDEAFFQTKGQWNCGWHLCSSCKKNAHYLCYTCTFSLCKSCVKDGIIYVVRGNKGFCDICMRTVKMIESVIQGDNAAGQVDFDDKTSWEYLFKDYYVDLKEKLSITAEEIEGAKNPWKGADVNSGKQEFQDNAYDDEVGSDDSAGQSEVSRPKKRKASKRLKSPAKERKLPRRSNRVNVTDVSRTDGVEWATKELLDFVMHMKDGDRSVLSQFDVQALLLEYIKTNKLRDPRRKSQIICDSRLQSLFGKPRVGHFEMLKLLESHFLIKDDTGDLQGSVVDIDANQTDADQNADISPKAGKQKKRKTRRRGDNRALQSNIDDYAAIDVHNITLIYLRRSLVEDLLEDTESFDDKVIGSFVRIRIPGNNPKQEMYRLVPIIGTSKVPKPYKVGKKHTDYVLEIQNLGKPETIQIDIISNQEFTQDECLRLRQSIKYGVTNRLTVGDIQDKAIALQEVRVKDWLDAEIVRLSHLRDRASEKGHAKELRECVEKLQLLKMPQERQRRLNEVSEIHADPKMDPNNESDDNEDIPTRGRSNASGGKSREPISPSKGVSSLNDSWGGIRAHSSGNRELTRSMSSKGVESWSDDGIRAVGDGVNQNTYLQARERDLSSESANARLKIDSSSKVAPETPVASLTASTVESTDKVNESEKMWHYKDPSGKIQGPFSIVQLRKWNNTGYFPVDLRIWRASETQDDTILLSDALKGKFLRVRPKTVSTAPAVQSQYPSSLYATNQSPVLQGSEPIGDRIVSKVPPSSVKIPKFSSSRWSSSTNLPSPTPHQTTPSTVKGPTDEVKWSSVTAAANSSVAAQSSTPSLVNTGGITGADVLRNVSSVLSQDPNMLMNAASALLAQSQSALPGQQRLNMEAHVQNAQASDMKNPGSAIQNLVQAVQSHNPAANVQGWGSASALPETSGSAPSQRPGQWGEPPMQNPSSYGTASSGGAFPNHWRPNSGDQSNFQSAAVPGANWGVNNTTNAFAAVPAPNSQSQPNPNPNWMQAPGNTGWSGSAPGNANMSWSGSANTGLPGQGRPQGSGTLTGWNVPSQGAFGNTANPGMVPPGQAPPPTQNSSFGWSGPGNRGGWMGDKNHNDGRYRERGDSGYGGGRPWNRQSSFGARDQGVCWYQDEFGNCRRGASCKFRHAGGSSGNLG